MPRPPVIPPFRNASDILHPPYRAWRPQPSRLTAVARKETDAGDSAAQTPEPMAVEESIRIQKRPGDGTLQIVPSNFRFKAFLKNLWLVFHGRHKEA